MCPHCLIGALAGSLVVLKTAPIVIPMIKDKFSRQKAMTANFDTLYGKKDDDHAR